LPISGPRPADASARWNRDSRERLLEDPRSGPEAVPDPGDVLYRVILHRSDELLAGLGQDQDRIPWFDVDAGAVAEQSAR